MRRRYIGNLEIEDGRHYRLYNEAGYADIEGDSVSYHFIVRDHLGSARAVTDADHRIEQSVGFLSGGAPVHITANTGRTADRLHSGKQWVDFAGLGWIDNRARWYDPLLMRFTTPDAQAGSNPSLSYGLLRQRSLQPHRPRWRQDTICKWSICSIHAEFLRSNPVFE